MTSAAPLFVMIAIGVAGLALGGLTVWTWRSPRRRKSPPLPSLWAISPRPVFNASERRLHRQLKDAFPQHVVMTKLPLVRLCQPDDRDKVGYWYGLLGSTHATFTICSSNGTALLAIDLESRRARSRRQLEIKEAVLQACRIKYFSIAADGMPTIEALQLLLPPPSAETHPVVPQQAIPPDSVVAADGGRLAAPTALSPPPAAMDRWQDSSVFMDSFFAQDSRMDRVSDADIRQAPSRPPRADRSVEGVVTTPNTPATTEETSAARVAGR